MPENGCRTRRREEAEFFSKQATLHAKLHATLHATLPNCWQGQHFGALMLLRNEVKIQVSFSVLTWKAAPGSISVVLRVV